MNPNAQPPDQIGVSSNATSERALTPVTKRSIPPIFEEMPVETV
jgi:hypothetical protein